MGAHMSSMGSALTKLEAANPMPLKNDGYVIDAQVAQALLNALERYDPEALKASTRDIPGSARRPLDDEA
jgi:proteasome assembly chaperone (PAC2) family protein